MSLWPLAGIVLAGGQSRRMGRDKALLPLPAMDSDSENESSALVQQRPQNFLEHSYALVAALACQAWVATGSERPRSNFPQLFDALPNSGPGAGILAGLEAAKAQNLPALLVLACDLPLLEPVLLERLVQAWFAAPEKPQKPLISLYSRFNDGPYPQNRGRDLEMLAAVYSIECAPLLAKALAGGERALWRIFPKERLLIHKLEAHEAKNLYNCNYPEDLAKLSTLGKKS